MVKNTPALASGNMFRLKRSRSGSLCNQARSGTAWGFGAADEQQRGIRKLSGIRILQILMYFQTCQYLLLPILQYSSGENVCICANCSPSTPGTFIKCLVFWKTLFLPKIPREKRFPSFIQVNNLLLTKGPGDVGGEKGLVKRSLH